MSLFSKICKKAEKWYYLHVKNNAVAYARKLGVQIGSDCNILGDPSLIFNTEPWLIKLGNHVEVTHGVRFLNHEGGMWCARRLDEKHKEDDILLPIIVGNNVMIGMNSLIMPGVHIGNNVIIGGQSVVTKDVPDGAIVAGVPARQISNINNFLAKLEDRETFATAQFSADDKLQHVKSVHPEWFS